MEIRRCAYYQLKYYLNLTGYMFEQSRPTHGIAYNAPQTTMSPEKLVGYAMLNAAILKASSWV
jgi:hypothetical protein